MVGDFSHVSSGATLCVNVVVGADTHIGAGSVVRQGIEIGNGTLLGIGSVVVKNISDNEEVYGKPCSIVRAV